MALPTSAPIPAVTAIASAPQKPTLKPGLTTGAPPAQAPSAPSAIRKTNAAAGTATTTASRATRKAAKRRQRGADRERDRRRPGGLDRIWLCRFGEPELVTGVRRERIPGHQLIGHLARELRLHAAVFVDMGELAPLLERLLMKRALLALQIGGLGIRLRAH